MINQQKCSTLISWNQICDSF